MKVSVLLICKYLRLIFLINLSECKFFFSNTRWIMNWKYEYIIEFYVFLNEKVR